MLSSVARTEKRLTIARLILNQVTDFSLIVWALYHLDYNNNNEADFSK
jgi:hypothetical protein